MFADARHTNWNLQSWLVRNLGNVPGNTDRKMEDECDGGSASTWDGCLVRDTWETRFKRSMKQSGAPRLGLFGIRLCGLCRPPRRMSTVQKKRLREQRTRLDCPLSRNLVC